MWCFKVAKKEILPLTILWNQLAIASGINPSTIKSIFKVIKKAPSSDTIHYICIGFGISIKDFYDSKLFDDLDDND